MARQDALQGSLPLLVLKLLARRGPLHGYGVATQIENMSDETLRVEEGSLYPALQRMLLKGWIAGEWGRTDENRRARYYRLTAAGRRQLEREVESYARIADAIARILQPGEETQS
jgi:PadR family transcriptional regulator, regulatory protein PadR